MKPSETLQRLLDMHGEKAAMLRRHEAVARIATQYDLNNSYQYIIARESQHLDWLADAIRDGGGTPPDRDAAVYQLAAAKGTDALLDIVSEDAAQIDAFVSTWCTRAAAMTNARHARMLSLMLGEMQEQGRLLRQAGAGRVDLLGRRTGGARTRGIVLPTRWVE